MLVAAALGSSAEARAGVDPAGITAAAPTGLGLGSATVTVSVATVWKRPSSVRSVDAPALANPVRIRGWLAAMTLAQRRGLSGRAVTQVVLGERVRVVALSGSWARVVVADQPTPLDPRGYPGWIPKRQLVHGVLPASTPTVTVVKATTWLRTGTGSRVLEASFGSTLQRTGRSGTDWLVRLPDGRTARVPMSSAVTHPLAATEASMVASARRFLGLDYLWAGTSGFGFDCSGLMHMLYRVHGIRIPRDSVDQARGGHAVARSALRPGDLLFFATNGVVHHVGMYVGRGRMLHAPQTGSQVKVVPLFAGSLGKEYSGARRYLPRTS
jgi:cell wall-associated NlpC family hydrolase